MTEEEKGFIIKDKRSFDEKGHIKEEEKAEKEGKHETKQKELGKAPLPEVNFNTLIFSLSSSALLHMGEISDPQSGETKKDLDLAKHSIDIIGMLKEKTKGNLADDERQFLDNILTDLRLRFVKASK
ncbi:MAG: DUF1844 domain-containing protein [Deltaproteobacteria bacterium]|nr:DUF1844 domain-containing protein [Deltaproteobacteria bacterium]